jgi:hypothetical protein
LLRFFTLRFVRFERFAAPSRVETLAIPFLLGWSEV